MKRGLGKGLGALINVPETLSEGLKGEILHIDINLIEPNENQPRKIFDPKSLEELAASIKEYGIIQPLVVNSHKEFYKIIAGERRYRASRIAGLTELPCIVKSYDEMESLQIALIENIQRQDLNPIEEALCYKQLEEYFFHNKEAIAKKVGKSKNTIVNRLNLLNLDEDVQELILENKISSGHGLKLTQAPLELQLTIAQKIIDEDLSLKDVESLTEELTSEQPEKQEKSFKILSSPFRNIEDNLKEILGTKVSIKGREDKGKIEIEYYSKEEMERLLELLQK